MESGASVGLMPCWCMAHRVMTFVWVQLSTSALKRWTRLFWDWTLTFAVGWSVKVSGRLIWRASIVAARWGLEWPEMPWTYVWYFLWYVVWYLHSDFEGHCWMPWLADKQLKHILLFSQAVKMPPQLGRLICRNLCVTLSSIYIVETGLIGPYDAAIILFTTCRDWRAVFCVVWHWWNT